MVAGSGESGEEMVGGVVVEAVMVDDDGNANVMVRVVAVGRVVLQFGVWACG